MILENKLSITDSRISQKAGKKSAKRAIELLIWLFEIILGLGTFKSLLKYTNIYLVRFMVLPDR